MALAGKEIAGKTSSTQSPVQKIPTVSRTLPGNPRSDAVSLEVPVKVHGSRIASGSAANSSTERFEEQTSTMIVFPEGGVVRMTTPVSTGQMLVLTNLKSRQDAICRVVKVRAFPNAPSYVEIEFTRALAAYWGVYFAPRTGAGPKPHAQPLAAQSSPKAPEAAHAAPAAIPDSLPKPISQTLVVPAPVPEPPELRVPSPPMPPVPPAPPAVPASQFVLIGSHEEVAVAAESTISTLPSEIMSPLPAPSENRMHTSTLPPAISDLRVPANPSRPEAAPPPSVSNPSSASAPLTIEPERMSVSLLAESTAAPAASTRIRPPVLSGSFGTRLDSAPSGDETVAGDSRHNWLLIAAGVVILFGTVAAGAWYLRARVAQNQAALGTNANPAAAAPQRNEQPAVPPGSQSPTTAQPAKQASPVASIPANPAEARLAEPKNTGASLQSSPAIVGAKDNFGVLGEERSHSTAARTSLPASEPNVAEKTPASMLKPAPLNAHPVLKKRAVSLPGQAPAVDQSAAPGAGAAGLLAMAPSKLAVPAPPETHVLPNAPVRVGGLVKQPKLISTVMPIYPYAAREANVQGDVVIDTQISASGSVVHMKVVSGPAMLRQPAMDALRHWKYQPSELDGKPVAVDMLVTLRFRL